METRPPNETVLEHRAYARCAQLTVDVLFQGKWQVRVLCAMCHGPVRLGQLRRAIPGASSKVLTHTLRKLEAGGIIIRRDFSDLVLHVEYDLRPEVRESIVSLLNHLSGWGATFHSDN